MLGSRKDKLNTYLTTLVSRFAQLCYSKQRYALRDNSTGAMPDHAAKRAAIVGYAAALFDMP
eukprot:5076764-Pyramimonas_sp.AAC.1